VLAPPALILVAGGAIVAHWAHLNGAIFFQFQLAGIGPCSGHYARQAEAVEEKQLLPGAAMGRAMERAGAQ